MNVNRDIMRDLTAKELLGWEAYAQVEPFNVDIEARADARAASIVQMLYNVNRGKGQAALKLGDAMLKFNEVKGDGAKRYSPQTQQEMLSVLKALSVMQNTIVANNVPEAKD